MFILSLSFQYVFSYQLSVYRVGPPRLTIFSSLSTYNLDQRNSLYMGANMMNMNAFPQQPLPSSHHYPNGQPTKKRRSTASGPKPPPPIPTPKTSITSIPEDKDNKANNDPTPTPTTATKPSDIGSQNHMSTFTPPGSANPQNNANANAVLSFSPSFSFSGLPQLDPTPDASSFDPMLSMPTPYDQQPTPSGASASGSTHTEQDKDPFLSLLEQLAENEQSRGGPSELDFFLSTGGGTG